MDCLCCGEKTRVIDTRLLDDNVVYRRRKCLSCDYLFHTLEEAIDYEDIAHDLNKVRRRQDHRRSRKNKRKIKK